MANEPIQIKNNFSALKHEFKTDTGLEANKENMSLYIQYYNARMNDYSYQILHGATHLLMNKIDFLPSQIRLQIAEMIRDHNVIKDLVQKLSSPQR